MRIKRAVAAQCTIRHPGGSSDLDFLYGTIFVWPGAGAVHSTNVCIFAEGEVDRSPTGTGVSGRAAIHHAKGELALGQSIRIESIVQGAFDVRVVELVRVGALEAVVPEVTGSAYITGRHTFWVDPQDPFKDGFLLR
jgi:trans-L-3-hydroxyproline dehydratase